MIRAGDTVRVTLRRPPSSEHGVYDVTAREHPDVPDLIVGTITEHDREIVLRRPNGDQPFPAEVIR